MMVVSSTLNQNRQNFQYKRDLIMAHVVKKHILWVDSGKIQIATLYLSNLCKKDTNRLTSRRQAMRKKTKSCPLRPQVPRSDTSLSSVFDPLVILVSMNLSSRLAVSPVRGTVAATRYSHFRPVHSWYMLTKRFVLSSFSVP